jgi:hypothetical protein
MKNIFLLAVIALGLYSCKEIDGRRTFMEQGFSTTKLLIGAQGCDTLITSQRDEWSLNRKTSIDGKPVFLPFCSTSPRVCSDDSIYTVKYDNLTGTTRLYIVQIECDWFKITRETSKRMRIIISPNLTGTTHSFSCGLYLNGSRLEITQLPD